MKNKNGQALIEACASMAFIISVLILGIILMCQFWAKNVLTKWAALHCRCVTTSYQPAHCKNTITAELAKYFGFKNIYINHRLAPLYCHANIKAEFMGLQNISAFYDFGTSEYKRTSHD